jgi:hypothetical protein
VGTLISHNLLLGRRAISEVSSADTRAFQRDVTAGKTAADVKTGPHGRAIVTGGGGAATRTLGLLGAIMQYARLSANIALTIRFAASAKKQIKNGAAR